MNHNTVKEKEVYVLSIILDVAVVILLVKVVISSGKKGFARSILDVIGYVVAIFAAYYLSMLLSNVLYSIFFKTSVETAIQNNLPIIKSAASVTEAVQSVLESISGFFAGLISLFGVNAASVIESVPEANMLTAATSAEEIANMTVKPVFVSIVTVLLFLIVFAICLRILKKISFSINEFLASSFVGPVNMVLGGAFGLAKGVLITIILTTIVGLFMEVSDSSFAQAIGNAVSDTYVLRFLFNLNPFVNLSF